jgi:anti-sigma regulatory factor (Ser/Thr protein kinase)
VLVCPIRPKLKRAPGTKRRVRSPARESGYGRSWMDVWTYSLRPSVDSVRLSRRLIRGALATFDIDFIEDAAILTDELVANAIIHGEPPIGLNVRTDEETLSVAVTDGGAGTAEPRPLDPSAERGRGLTIVDKLSDAWGVTDLPQGKCVWFELKLKRVMSEVRHGLC